MLDCVLKLQYFSTPWLHCRSFNSQSDFRSITLTYNSEQSLVLVAVI